LLAFGWHAPFYHFLYSLPYFSTIRLPIKWMHPFQMALLILFGYGLQALSRQYLEAGVRKATTPAAGSNTWWGSASSFEKKWTIGMVAMVGASLLAWLIYASSRREMLLHLQRIGFTPELAPSIFSFSLHEVVWFVVFLILSVLAVMMILRGVFSGGR